MYVQCKSKHAYYRIQIPNSPAKSFIGKGGLVREKLTKNHYSWRVRAQIPI